MRTPGVEPGPQPSELKIAGSSPARVNLQANGPMCVACVPVMCLYVAVPAAMRSCVGVHLVAYLCACAVVRAALCECARGLGKAPTVGLEPTTTRLRALRSAD